MEILKKQTKRFQFLIILFVCVMLFSVQAYAGENKSETGSLTLNSQFTDEEFSLYRIADFSETGEFTNVADWVPDSARNFDGLGSEGWRELAITLGECVKNNEDISPIDQLPVKNEKNQFVWENIKKALYLVIGESVEDEGKIYTPTPTLVTIPNRTEEGAWYNTPEITVKYEQKDKYDKSDMTVVKIWKDAGLESSRPQEVVVQLLRDGKPYADEVKLSKDNNWTYTWEELSAEYEWKVTEKDVPKGYKVSIKQEGNTWSITNTAIKTSSKSNNKSGSKLPQTGQLWWPIPILVLLGIGLYTAGWTSKKKSEIADDQKKGKKEDK
ncbi:MAG: Cna B-type domain-containing protein [Lachnospiraceae bacterium]